MDHTEWKRPESIPYPTVWLRCKGKRPMQDGKIPKFRIQCITEDMFDEVVDLMCNFFARDEYLCESTRITDDPVSMGEFRDIWLKFVRQKIGLVAIKEDDGEKKDTRPRIAGLNITGVSLKSDKLTSDMFKGVASRTIMEFILNYVLKDVDIFKLYGVDKYMSAFGLLVHPDFRGQGLSEQLLKARFPLGKALGLKATMTFFTPVAAQKASEKAGMRCYTEAVYNDYKIDGKIVFPNLKSKSMKVMVAEF